MQSLAACSPLQHSRLTIGRIMLLVVVACIPGISMATWFFGYGLIINIGLAICVALALEAAILTIRQKNVRLHLADNSALVTAVLFGIAIPPGCPWWIVVIGIFFAIVVAKHIYGGLGQNPFNPAMCGYLLLLLSFPLEMASWYLPSGSLLEQQSFNPLSWSGLQQSMLLSMAFLAVDSISMHASIDGLAMATPLAEFNMAGKSALLAAQESGLSIFARTSGTGWELVNIGYLLGGLFLLYRRIISWHIPLSLIVTVGLLAMFFYAPGSSAAYGTPYLHLFGSATMIGAFFIATDPVSAATTNKGKIVYGIVIGCAIYAIRVWGSYLDSIALAVLFGNFCAPALDHFCRPRIYGHGRSKELGS